MLVGFFSFVLTELLHVDAELSIVCSLYMQTIAKQFCRMSAKCTFVRIG